MGKVIAILKHPLSSMLSRFVLGGIFIYASLGKIQDPQGFADILYNYRLLPDFLVNFLAVYLPWLEMMAGLCLMAGIFARTNAIILSSMLAVFIVALTINAVRGLDFNCGCFSPGRGGKQQSGRTDYPGYSDADTGIYYYTLYQRTTAKFEKEK